MRHTRVFMVWTEDRKVWRQKRLLGRSSDVTIRSVRTARAPPPLLFPCTFKTSVSSGGGPVTYWAKYVTVTKCRIDLYVHYTLLSLHQIFGKCICSCLFFCRCFNSFFFVIQYIVEHIWFAAVRQDFTRRSIWVPKLELYFLHCWVLHISWALNTNCAVILN